MRLAISRTHRSCVELFHLVDWAQFCGTNRGHSAGRLSLPGDDGLVTSKWLAAAIPVVAVGDVAANGEPLGVSPRCAAILIAVVGDLVVFRDVQPDTPRIPALLHHSTQTNLHGGEIGGRN